MKGLGLGTVSTIIVTTIGFMFGVYTWQATEHKMTRDELRRVSESLNEKFEQFSRENVVEFERTKTRVAALVTNDGNITRENISGWQDGINNRLGIIEGYLIGYDDGIRHLHGEED